MTLVAGSARRGPGEVKFPAVCKSEAGTAGLGTGMRLFMGGAEVGGADVGVAGIAPTTPYAGSIVRDHELWRSRLPKVGRGVGGGSRTVCERCAAVADEEELRFLCARSGRHHH